MREWQTKIWDIEQEGFIHSGLTNFYFLEDGKLFRHRIVDNHAHVSEYDQELDRRFFLCVDDLPIIYRLYNEYKEKLEQVVERHT